MRRDGYPDLADDLKDLLEALVNGSSEQKKVAAKTISANCHVKYYGDLNLDVAGSGSYPLWSLLGRIKEGLSAF